METSIISGLTQQEAENRHKVYGFNEVLEKKAHPLLKFFARFWGLTAWMLELIILLSWFLHKHSDAYIVAGLLIFNAIIGFVQEQNAANAVAALRKRLQVNVKLLRDGIWNTVSARELVPGDIIRIRMGDFVPADMKVIVGEIYADQSALTGESVDAAKKPEDIVYSGSIVTKGEATGMVTETGRHTYFGKTVQLVNIAKPKSHVEAIISQVVKWLLTIVAVLLTIAFVVSLSRGINPLEILPLLLVLLLGAIPVALTAMFTVSMALGSRQLVGQGVLVTRLNAFDDAASMDVLCVDKTGTLTMNRLSVARVLPSDGYTENEVLLWGALASSEANHDAIDMAFINAARQKDLLDNAFVQKNFTPFDSKNRKTEALIKKDDKEFKVMKGAFSVIVAECGLNETTVNDWAARINVLAKLGYRVLAVGEMKDKNAPCFAGLVALHDPPRSDSAKIIGDLKDLGVSVKMLTGDALPIAQEISKELHIGDKILQASEFKDLSKSDPGKVIDLLEQANGFAEVYPEDKYTIVKLLQSTGHIVGMTGDGVNDSPALKQAEVGIAVSNATDVAKGAASVVLTAEGLSNIPAPIKVGRMMFQRINLWILNKIARTILKTCFVVVAFLISGKYVISASAMLIMIFMTDFVKISLATDNVKWSDKPARWNINGLAKTGILIGFLMVVEAFGLLYFGLNYFHLDADNEALNTFSFETLLFFALFSIFVVREKRHFWNSRPGKVLSIMIMADMVLGVLISTFGILGLKAIALSQTILIIVYTCFFSFVVNDWIKFILLKNRRTDITHKLKQQI